MRPNSFLFLAAADGAVALPAITWQGVGWGLAILAGHATATTGSAPLIVRSERSERGGDFVPRHHARRC